MSTALDQIVNIVITQQTAAVPQPSFSVPLIVGPNAPRTLSWYTDPASMLADGFSTSDAEYIYASRMMSQALSPTTFGVGLRLPAAAQTSTLSVNSLTIGHDYLITVAGTVVSYVSQLGDVQEDVLAGIRDAIAAVPALAALVAGVVSGTGGSASMLLTGVTNGIDVAFTAVGSKLTYVAGVTAHGIVDDMTAIIAESTGQNWYGVCMTSQNATDILQMASLIESMDKIFIAATADAAVDSSSTSDLASVLKGYGYTRTALIYSPISAALGIEAALLGGQLPQTPGASTWKFKQLVGISPDLFGSTSRTRLIGLPGVSTGKGVNIYESVGGVNITEEGWMVGGQFIDVTIGLDWLKSTMQTAIYTQLAQLAKIPYTDKGAALLEGEVKKVLKQASDEGGSGLLDATSLQTNVAKVATIPSASRAARILPNNSLTFSARLTGAFHFITVNGTVTV